MHSKCTPTHSMSDILARTANALFNRKGDMIWPGACITKNMACFEKYMYVDKIFLT